ncbi:hypothetical protein CVT25_010811 [Psilocybe cyanescens]|uniref:Asl1-like glycosyl hydrolase catalytic domain-containing protein n=1 Tax=Psilocybe cyanescens TaxID=93625 RepID=A0A409WF42_PSICY|nr:hypothetical protein CVT25_010811 [Psilocybe cyanescens]
MVSLKISSIVCAVLLAGQVDAGHIKKSRFPSHRSQCLPRLTSSVATEVASTLYAHSVSLGSSSSSVILAASEMHHSTSAVNPIPSSIRQTTRSSSTSIHSSAHSTPSSTAAVTSEAHQSSSAVWPISSSADQPTHSALTASTQATTPTTSVITSSSETSTKISPVGETATPLGSSLVPNSNKAGIAGGDAYPFVKDHIGWWYDWSPTPSKPGPPIAVPMLWGDGTVDKQDADRLKAFKQLTTIPRYVLGFEEPDCPSGSGSAGMSVQDGVAEWEALMAPLKARGAKLGSPSMCKQADETWLTQFKDQISTMWDFTAIHINKNSLAGVQKDIAHYKQYGKPIWVTEFACVNDYQQFTPCTDQAEIDNFIQTVVPFFEESNDVFAYGYSNGLGLGDAWPLMKGNSLSESGKTYLAAISQYH